jgi:uncharacterized Zn finger protein
VRVFERDYQHLRAEVADTHIVATQLLVRDGAQGWSCTCGEADGRLCWHPVATALATWLDEAPADEGYD